MRRYILPLILLFMWTSAQAQSTSIPLPSKAQLRWQQYERTMFLCLDPCTWQGREYDNHSYPISQINPTRLNTDQWCEVAQSWGAKMILFVAKHTGGFCWWQTNTSEYGIKNTPWRNGKGDVLKELSQSCRKYGLGLGIYVYPGDETWGAGIGSGGKTADPSKQEAYNQIYRQQLTEVLTQYGPIREVWFDGSCHIPVDDILEKYASDAVILQGPLASIRWVGSEEGITPYPNWYTINKKDLDTGVAISTDSDVNGDCYAPVESDIPFLKHGTHKWFWAPNTDSYILPLDRLMNLYYKSVGRGSVLLLNATPDTIGLIPESHVKRYAEFGAEINRRFANPIQQKHGKTTELTISLKQPTVINHCIIQEQLKKGQRITAYVIEGQTADGQWQTLVQGSSVGSKKIDHFPDTEVQQVRLRVTQCKATPDIANFAIYHVETELNDLTASSDQAEKPIVVSSWENNSFAEDQWSDLELDLTPYVTRVGVYDISFNIVVSDYRGQGPTGLQLKDWQLEMYGQDFPAGITRLEGQNVFRITRSQQTLDEFPTRLRLKVKRNPTKSSGEITIQRVVY